MLKGLIKKDLLYLGGVSPSFPQRCTSEPADKQQQVARTVRQEEAGKKDCIWGKHLQSPDLSLDEV